MTSPVPAALRLVTQRFDVTREEILSRDQTARVTEARYVAMWLAARHTRLPMNRLGDRFGRRETAVYTAMKTVEARRRGEAFRAATDALAAELAARLAAGQAAFTTPTKETSDVR